MAGARRVTGAATSLASQPRDFAEARSRHDARYVARMIHRRGPRSLARSLEARFDDHDCSLGRALLRRRRVRLAARDERVQRVRVRAPDADHDVVVTTDERGIIEALVCPCERFTREGHCGHAWGAALAIDRRRALAEERAGETS